MAFWVFGVPVDPTIGLSMALRRVGSWDDADQRQTEEVPISRALRPSFDLFLGLQVMPCLSACFVQESPSLNVSSHLFIDRGYGGAIQMLLRVIWIAFEDCLLHLRHL